MNHGEPVEDISIYSLTPEKVQTKIEAAIDAGKALDLSGFLPSEAHGDRYISVWILDQLLKARFPGKKINLAYSGDPLHTPKPFVNIGEMLEVIGFHNRPTDAKSFIEQKSRQFAAALGISEAELRRMNLPDRVPTPTPLQSDRIFGSFNLEKQRAAAEQIRANPEWQGRPIIAVFQSGSIPEKRFSDQQVEQVVETVRRQTPDAVIIVVTDRELLNINKFDRQERTSPPTYGDKVERVVKAENLDAVGAVAVAADRIITTDTLWAWWGAGCKVLDGQHPDGKLKPGELLELMTVARKHWQVPGSDAVLSTAVEKVRRAPGASMIVSQDYLDYYGHERGIHQTDIDRFLQAIPPKKSRWFSLLKK